MNSAALTALLVLNGLEGNTQTHLSGLQPFLIAHIDALMNMWWAVLVCTLITVTTLAMVNRSHEDPEDVVHSKSE